MLQTAKKNERPGHSRCEPGSRRNEAWMLWSLNFVLTLEKNLTSMVNHSVSRASDAGWSVIAPLSDIALKVPASTVSYI